MRSGPGRGLHCADQSAGYGFELLSKLQVPPRGAECVACHVERR
jgi:hypothetical protein